jgi:4'-phosphopantetheinyl transferase EntD
MSTAMRPAAIEADPTSGNPANLSAPLAELFPPGVVAAELRSPVGADLLLPEEARGCEAFAPKRLGEFAAGRVCARRALAELGYGGFALRRGADRYPIWPDGIVGSITHTRGFCGAAVAPYGATRGVGLDAERGAIGPELWPQICTDAEIAWLDSLPEPNRAIAAAVIFSAKEAFYKCQFGVGGKWLEFHDIEIEIKKQTAMESGTFLVWPVQGGKLAGTVAGAQVGRFRVDGDLIMTGIALTAAG